MSVPQQAVAGHLGHDDAEMTCADFRFSLGSQL